LLIFGDNVSSWLSERFNWAPRTDYQHGAPILSHMRQPEHWALLNGFSEVGAASNLIIDRIACRDVELFEFA